LPERRGDRGHGGLARASLPGHLEGRRVQRGDAWLDTDRRGRGGNPFHLPAPACPPLRRFLRRVLGHGWLSRTLHGGGASELHELLRGRPGRGGRQPCPGGGPGLAALGHAARLGLHTRLHTAFRGPSQPHKGLQATPELPIFGVLRVGRFSGRPRRSPEGRACPTLAATAAQNLVVWIFLLTAFWGCASSERGNQMPSLPKAP
jgi:hypothetical protein